MGVFGCPTTIPNPNFSKPRTKTANSDFWSWLTHQLLGRSKFTNPNLLFYWPKKDLLTKKGEFWEVGDWQSMQDSFCWVCRRTSAWRGLMTGICGILESSATQWYQDGAPTQEFFFFHRPIYSLCYTRPPAWNRTDTLRAQILTTASARITS